MASTNKIAAATKATSYKDTGRLNIVVVSEAVKREHTQTSTHDGKAYIHDSPTLEKSVEICSHSGSEGAKSVGAMARLENGIRSVGRCVSARGQLLTLTESTDIGIEAAPRRGGTPDT